MIIDLIERVQRRFTKRLPGYSNYTYNERLTLLKLPSLELRRLRLVRQATATRGHPYKLFKPQCTINARPSFFTQRIINVWNDLPVNTTNFSSLNCLRNSLNEVDLSSYLVLG